MLLSPPPCLRSMKEVGCPGSTPWGLPCPTEPCCAHEIRCLCKRRPGPSASPAAVPGSQTHGDCPRPPGSASGTSTWPARRQARCNNRAWRVDVTLQFVRTLSTRALLGRLPYSLLKLPWPHLSLSLPWVRQTDLSLPKEGPRCRPGLRTSLDRG